MVNKSKGEAESILFGTAIENFSLPGEKSFPLGGFVTPPGSKQDAGKNTIRPFSRYLPLTRNFILPHLVACERCLLR